MIKKSDSKGLPLATVSILGQPPRDGLKQCEIQQLYRNPSLRCFLGDAKNHHHVISPNIKFHASKIDYTVNKLGESAKTVPQGFEYHSGSNKKFLIIEEIRAFNNQIMT